MFTVVIDESGDTGLSNVQPDPSNGPSQYFCSCATFFRDENTALIEKTLKRLINHKGLIRANRMSHFEKINACNKISQLPIGMVGVISNKLSLLKYLSEAKKTPTHFYNKVMQYQLERVGAAMGAFGIAASEVRIHIEARAQQYGSLLSFVRAIQENPLDTRAAYIRNIDRFSISAVDKKDSAVMALSDIGANAIFSAVKRDAKSFGFSETRYLKELAPAFVADSRGRIVPLGLKPIHSISDLGLPSVVSTEISSFQNPHSDYQRLT
ncbi:DUF3800 domain-containing protein [Pseudosulfitobacter sp. SM2401]